MQEQQQRKHTEEERREFSSRLLLKLDIDSQCGRTTATAPKLGKDLAEAYNHLYGTHFTDQDLRDVVKELRRSGQPIASTIRGYWYARHPDELDPAIASLRGRAEDMNVTAAALEATQRRMRATRAHYQPTLFGGAHG